MALPIKFQGEIHKGLKSPNAKACWSALMLYRFVPQLLLLIWDHCCYMKVVTEFLFFLSFLDMLWEKTKQTNKNLSFSVWPATLHGKVVVLWQGYIKSGGVRQTMTTTYVAKGLQQFIIFKTSESRDKLSKFHHTSIRCFMVLSWFLTILYQNHKLTGDFWYIIWYWHPLGSRGANKYLFIFPRSHTNRKLIQNGVKRTTVF